MERIELQRSQDSENVFYFFNPFSTGIFKKVVKNIIKSYEKHNRTWREADDLQRISRITRALVRYTIHQ